MKTTNNSAQNSPPVIPLKKRFRLQIARWLGDRKVAPSEKSNKIGKLPRAAFASAAIFACLASIWFINAFGARQKPQVETFAAESKNVETNVETIEEKPIRPAAATAAKTTQSGSGKTTARSARRSTVENETLKLSPADAALMRSRPVYKQPENKQQASETEKSAAKQSARIAQPFYQP